MKITAYFGSFFISLLGNSIANVVLPVLILVSTGQVIVAGLAALVSGASTFVFGLLSGPVIDHYDRRIVAAIGDFVSASSIGLLAVVGTFGQLSPAWFLTCAFLSGIGDLPAWNAREAMIYAVQRDSQRSLEALVGLRESMSALAIVLGPTCGGLLINFLDAKMVFWITAATSLTAGILCIFMPKAYGIIEDSGLNSSKMAYWGSLRDGLSFLLHRNNTVLRKITGLNVASLALVSVLQSLILPVVMTLAGHDEANGYALAAVGVGLLIGGIIYTIVGNKVPAWSMTLFAAVSNVASLRLLVQFYSVAYTLVMCFIFGITSSAVGAVTGVVSLQVTPEHMRGRINGLQNSISMVVGPIGVFAVALIISQSSVGLAGWVLVAFWALVNAVILLSRNVQQSIKAPREDQS